MSENEEELASKRRTAFLGRARKDIDEVLVEPTMQVFPREHEDGFDLCLALTPYGGKYAGFQLHFEVELRVTGKTPWPVFPPKVLLDKSLEHQLLPQGRGFHFPMCHGYFLSMIDEEKQLRLWGNMYEPSHTLAYIFQNLLHLISSREVGSGDPRGGYEEYRFESSLVTNYLSEAEYTLLQIPIEEALISQSRWDHLPGQVEQAWNADAGPETTLLSHQLGPTSMLTVHKVKYHLPSGRIHKIQKHTSNWYCLLKKISSTKCDFCPYGSSQLPHIASTPPPFPRDFPPVPHSLLCPPQSCKLGILLDDNLTEIAKWLDPPYIRALAAAYPRFDRILSQFQILQTRALRCSLLRTPLCDSGILGVKLVGMDFWQDPDDRGPQFLSLAGFEFHDTSIELSDRYWEDNLSSHSPPDRLYHDHPALLLPMALNVRHFQQHRAEIMQRLDMLLEVVTNYESPPAFSRRKCSFCPSSHTTGSNIVLDRLEQERTLKHIHLIVHWMAVLVDQMIGDPWHELITEVAEEPAVTEEVQTVETDKAVAWYCQLLHLALTLCRDDPSTLVEAKAFVREFLKGAGDFGGCDGHNIDRLSMTLVFLTIIAILEPAGTPEGTPPMEWSTVNGPLLQRLFHGTATQYLLTESFKHLQAVEIGVSDYRLVKTFQAMHQQLIRFMVGVSFFKGFAATYASNISLLDDNYGFIDAKLTERLLKDVKSCVKVKTWPDFFRQVGWSRGLGMEKDTFCAMLQKMVRDFEEIWCHGEDFEAIQAAREEDEAKWNENRRNP